MQKYKKKNCTYDIVYINFIRTDQHTCKYKKNYIIKSDYASKIVKHHLLIFLYSTINVLVVFFTSSTMCKKKN